MEEIVAAGDYSVFESEAKRQHFILRFHLKRFARVHLDLARPVFFA
jgi:hypothetical protein